MQDEKRYQVFVSSTFEDLREPRREVMQALLELDCFPSGMELFQAADEDQWTLIRREIERCDYYIVIVGGRYGSTLEDGMSYTEKEYRCALELEKPILGFVHEEPGEIKEKWSEKDSEKRARLEEFIALVRKKMCKTWKTAEDLGGKVSRSVVRLRTAHPRPGWVRGDVASPKAMAEILRLQDRVKELESQLAGPPAGAARLAHGDEVVELDFEYQSKEYAGLTAKMSVCWDDLFQFLGPLMMGEASDNDLKHRLWSCMSRVAAGPQGPADFNDELRLDPLDYDTILVQFRALGLVTESTKKRRPAADQNTYWTLTPHGDSCLTRLLAIESDPRTESQPRLMSHKKK